jgi:tetratricopeptide (TPR) repeat protein
VAPTVVPLDTGGEFDEFPTRESLPDGDDVDGKNLELAHDPFLETLNDRPTDGDAIDDEERRPAASFEGRRKWERQGRKTRIILLTFLGVLILGGAGMTFTPLGPFGAYALVKLVPKFGQDATIKQTVEIIDTRIKTDTPFALNHALKELERGLSELPDNEDLQLLGVYLHTWHQIRFGADKKHESTAMKLLGSIKLNESESPYAPLAEASRYALTRQTGKMTKVLGGEIGETPNAKALTIAGYLKAGIIEKALTYAIQLDKKENSARSGYFLAKSLSLNGAYSEAIEKLTKLIKKYPRHIDSKLALTQTYLRTKPIKHKEVLELTNDVVSSFSKISTSVQKAQAHASLGHLHLAERRVENAMKEFERAEKLDPDSISMLTGIGEISLANNDIPGAVSAFDKVLDADPHNIAAQLGKIETIFREGRFADALAELTAILPKNQKNARAHYLMGKVQIALKSNDLAEQELKTALEIDNEYLEAYVALSVLYITANKSSEAMRVLDEASKSIPESPLISQTLAEAHATLGDYATAIAELFKAIELDPDDIRSYFVMAQMYRRMNSIDDARNSLSEVENKNPNYPGLALERGILMELSGDKKAALELYVKELALSKDDTNLKIRIGATSHMLGDNDTAEKYLKEVIAVIPKSAEANFYLGEICRVTGRTAEAVGYLGSAAAQDPSNGLYHLRYGMSFQNTQDLKEAMKEYEIAKDIDPNLAEVYVRIGSVLLQQGAAKDAFQFLEKGLNLDPALYDAYWLMAESFEQRGELHSAVEHYRKAIKAAPKEAELYFRLGRVELKVYGTRTALSTLMKAVRLADDTGQTPSWFPEALYRLGMAQENRGQKTNARVTFKRYLDIAPEDDIDRSEVTARLERLGG